MPQPFAAIAQECLRQDPVRRCTLRQIKARLEPVRSHQGLPDTTRRTRFARFPVTVLIGAVLVLLAVIAVLQLRSHRIWSSLQSENQRIFAQHRRGSQSPQLCGPKPVQGLVVKGAVAERVSARRTRKSEPEHSGQGQGEGSGHGRFKWEGFQMLRWNRRGRASISRIRLCKRGGIGGSSLRKLIASPFPASGSCSFNSHKPRPTLLPSKRLLTVRWERGSNPLCLFRAGAMVPGETTLGQGGSGFRSGWPAMRKLPLSKQSRQVLLNQ